MWMALRIAATIVVACYGSTLPEHSECTSCTCAQQDAREKGDGRDRLVRLMQARERAVRTSYVEFRSEQTSGNPPATREVTTGWLAERGASVAFGASVLSQSSTITLNGSLFRLKMVRTSAVPIAA